VPVSRFHLSCRHRIYKPSPLPSSDLPPAATSPAPPPEGSLERTVPGRYPNTTTTRGLHLTSPFPLSLPEEWPLTCKSFLSMYLSCKQNTNCELLSVILHSVLRIYASANIFRTEHGDGQNFILFSCRKKCLNSEVKNGSNSTVESTNE
jgi:hypothetical protein